MNYKNETNFENISTNNSLLARKEVGEPFYIIDTIKNNICTCDIYSAPAGNKAVPILFLDKSLAENVVELLHNDSNSRHVADNRQVTGLSNFYFNVVYAIANDKSTCYVTSKMDSRSRLILKPYTLKEVRELYNLKTTNELK